MGPAQGGQGSEKLGDHEILSAGVPGHKAGGQDCEARRSPDSLAVAAGQEERRTQKKRVSVWQQLQAGGAPVRHLPESRGCTGGSDSP